MAAIETIGIIGAGAWGTALAQAAARAGRRVLLYVRDPELAAAITRDRTNPRHLPGIFLQPTIEATAEVGDLEAASALLLVVPAQAVRAVAAGLSKEKAPVVICAKGLEAASGARLSQVLADVQPGRAVAVLSGPNFAAEVAKGLPAATTLACADPDLGRRLAEALSGPGFRVYWTDDVIGVELGGALKNVIAIAAGIVAGRGLGENARAALITRGLAELGRLGEALGARRETLMGLSGLGDLLLTATSLTSRNMAFGHAIGRGADPTALRVTPGRLVEGVATAGAVVALGRRHAVDLPIAAAVAAILEGDLAIDAALDRLMRRPLRRESDP